MSDSELRARVVAIIRSIAPEVEESDLRDDVALRDQIDLDSMDWLQVMVRVHQQLHVDIPEGDYAKLRSLGDWVAYLRSKVPAP